jgi:hypothetical protein
MVAEAAHRWETLITLVPLFIVGIGLIAAVLILLVRAFADSVRGIKHKRLLWIGALAAFGFIVVLTYLGVNLPKE